MTDFFNREPPDTYKSIINIGTEPNETLDTSLKPLEDGRGNQSALSVSTTSVRALKLEIDDVIIDSNSINGSILDGGTYSTE